MPTACLSQVPDTRAYTNVGWFASICVKLRHLWIRSQSSVFPLVGFDLIGGNHPLTQT